MNFRQEVIGTGLVLGAEVLPKFLKGAGELASGIEQRIASIRLPRGVLDLRPKAVADSDPWAEVYRGEVLGRQSMPPLYTEPNDGLQVESLNGQTVRTKHAVIGVANGGLPAAFKLAESGEDVMAFDGGIIGDPRTPSAHGMMITYYPDLDFAPVAHAHGPEFFRNFYADIKAARQEVMARAQRHGDAVDFARITSHKIDYGDTSPVQEEFDLLSQQHDSDVRLLRGSDAASLLPGAKWALAIDNEGAFSAYKELRAYAQEAKFPIYQNTYVIGMRPKEAGRPTELFTADGGRVFVDGSVFIAAGRPVGGLESARRYMVPLQAHATRTIVPADRAVLGNNFDSGASFNYMRMVPTDTLPVPKGKRSMFLGGDAEFPLDGGTVKTESDHMRAVAKDMFDGEVTKQGQNMVFGTVIDGSPAIVRYPHARDVYALIGNGGNGAVSGQMAAEDFRRFITGETDHLMLSSDRLDRVPEDIRRDPALGPARARW